MGIAPCAYRGQELSSKLLYDHAGAGQIFGSLIALHQLFNNRRFDPELRSSAYCVPSQRPFCSPYQAFRGSGNLQVFQPQVNELGRLHRQWLSDLDGFKNSLRAQGAEPKALEYVNEAFGRLTERIKQLAG